MVIPSTLLAVMYLSYRLIINYLRYAMDVKRWFQKGCLTGSSGYLSLSQPSITLIFNTLEANNKNQQLSRGSKLVNAHQYVTGKTLMKSQTSARRIKNSISTLFKGAECFRLVRSFRPGRGRESAAISFKHLGAGHLQNVRGK